MKKSIQLIPSVWQPSIPVIFLNNKTTTKTNYFENYLKRSDGSLKEKKKQTKKWRDKCQKTKKIISTQLLASASLFCILVLQKKYRSEFFFDTSFAKTYLHFSHTWLDNKYSIFDIKIHRYLFYFDNINKSSATNWLSGTF